MRGLVKYLIAVATVVAPVVASAGVVYLPPSEDVIFEYAEVYLNFDSTHYSGASLSKRDSAQ